MGGSTAADEMNLTVDHFERRLSEETSRLRVEIAQQGAQLQGEMSALRVELKTDMQNGFASMRQEMATVRQEMITDRFELLKWSFLFWVGQFFAVAALMATMLRVLGPSR